jgi:hypothetical protein
LTTPVKIEKNQNKHDAARSVRDGRNFEKVLVKLGEHRITGGEGIIRAVPGLIAAFKKIRFSQIWHVVADFR